jgi:hypothetical protein
VLFLFEQRRVGRRRRSSLLVGAPHPGGGGGVFGNLRSKDNIDLTTPRPANALRGLLDSFLGGASSNEAPLQCGRAGWRLSLAVTTRGLKRVGLSGRPVFNLQTEPLDARRRSTHLLSAKSILSQAAVDQWNIEGPWLVVGSRLKPLARH